MVVTGEVNSTLQSIHEKDVGRFPIYERTVPSVKHKLIFISSRSGVGKTMVVINLAIALSILKATVGLADLNYQKSDLFRVMGLENEGETHSDSRFTPAVYSNEIKVMSIETIMKKTEDAGYPSVTPTTNDIKMLISKTDWGQVDYLLFDTVAGPGEELGKVIQAVPDANVILVTAPNKIDQERAGEMIRFIRKEDITIFGWIENMRGFLNQNCDRKKGLLGTGPVSRAVFLNDVPFLGRIPIDTNLEEPSDVAAALLEAHRTCIEGEPYNIISRKIMSITTNQ